jgi:hypothetical protein
VRWPPSASGAFGRGPAFFVSFFSGKKKKRKKNRYQKQTDLSIIQHDYFFT